MFLVNSDSAILLAIFRHVASEFGALESASWILNSYIIGVIVAQPLVRAFGYFLGPSLETWHAILLIAKTVRKVERHLRPKTFAFVRLQLLLCRRARCVSSISLQAPSDLYSTVIAVLGSHFGGYYSDESSPALVMRVSR